jgi:hypothetical protein
VLELLLFEIIVGKKNGIREKKGEGRRKGAQKF